MAKATFSIRRGGRDGGEMVDYQAEVSEGMVVLDAVHQIQAESAPDLACRWNCKATWSHLLMKAELSFKASHPGM